MTRSRVSKNSNLTVTTGHVGPCAIFWDIENTSVHSGQSPEEFVELIRDEVIRGKKLREVDFFCVTGSGKLTAHTENQIKESKVKVIHVGHQPNAADLKIIELIKKFVTASGYGCNIVLISGDSDFVKTLIRCKIKYKVKIFLFHCKSHRNDFLDAIADVVYLINNGKLRLVTKSSDVAVIEIKPSSEVFYSSTIRKDLQSMFEHQGAIKGSIYFDEYDKDDVCIWIGFPSKELAKEVARDKHNQPYHKHPLIVRYVQYPPAAVIKQLTKGNDISVREETMNTLRLLTPNSFSLTRSLSITSTISLPFKSSPFAYLIVTGFPVTFYDHERRQYLSNLLGKSIKSFKSTYDHNVWLHVHYPYQAKFYIDKIVKSNCNEFKLSATVNKQLPNQKTIAKASSQVPDTYPSRKRKRVDQQMPRQVTVQSSITRPAPIRFSHIEPRPVIIQSPTPRPMVSEPRTSSRIVAYPDLTQVVVHSSTFKPSPRFVSCPEPRQFNVNSPLPRRVIEKVEDPSTSGCCSAGRCGFIICMVIIIIIIIINVEIRK